MLETSYDQILRNQQYNKVNVGVGGMSEGFQILHLGILFQRLHHSHMKFLKKK